MTYSTLFLLGHLLKQVQLRSSSTCFASRLQNTNVTNNKAIIFVPKRMCLFFVTLDVELQIPKYQSRRVGKEKGE